MRAGTLGAAASVLTLALASAPAAAQVTGDTVASSDCSSAASEHIVEHHDGFTEDRGTDTWVAKRHAIVEARGRGTRRYLTLDFYGGTPSDYEGPSLAPTAARNFFDDRGGGGDPPWRRTTVVGDSSATVRLHIGERIIKLGVFKPDWDPSTPNNVVGPALGAGVGGGWYLKIPLRKYVKALRAHESKAGRRSRVSFTYKFPATEFVREEGYATGTKKWTAASCTLRTRRMKLGG